MAKLSLRKYLIAAAAAAMAIGAAAPASAGGRHHGGYHGHHYGKHYGKHHGYYYGSRHYRRHHHGGISGGEAALLAVGIIGGMVLIDRAMERDRYAYDPYYSSPPPRDTYYRRDDRPPVYRDESYRDDGYIGEYEDEGELLGAPDDHGYAASRYNYGAAYNDCKAETREAARKAGVIVSLPAKPQVIDEIDGGAAVRFTAHYVASDRSGEYRRTMVCEADAGGVRLLELV